MTGVQTCALPICFVVIEAFRGVGTDDLDVGQCRQHHHQMAYLDFDIGVGQHRDIGGRYKVEEQLALIGGKAVFREGTDAHKLLHRTAFFLFLCVFYFQISVTSKKIKASRFLRCL